MRAKRFYYVASERSTVMHISDKRTEGARTWCGALLRRGWKWRRGKLKLFKVCKKCTRTF